MSNYRFLIDEQFEGERLDKGLSLLTDDSFSRSFLQKLIKEKKVFVNDNAQKSSYLLKDGDEIFFEAPECVTPEIIAQDIPLDILYEDEDVIVVNKPKDMVVHPAPGHYSDTLVNAVMFHCKGSLSGINGVMRPGIVHRIDKDTTGSLVICKNDLAHEKIAEQLQDHSINREYVAIVTGVIENDNGIIDKPIKRSIADRRKMTVDDDGKRAVTHYEVIERYEKFTFVKCRLETGRTHQIRVHMASIGHPVAGDELYGNKAKTPVKTFGQALHAKTLGFIHPRTGEYIEVSAPLPDYFKKFLILLQKV